MAENEVAVAIETCCEYCNFPDDILNNPVAYEDPEKSINIAIDDVIVKKQEEIRKGGRKCYLKNYYFTNYRNIIPHK